MKVAFGLEADSGWAALVVVGMSGGSHAFVDRRRIELVEHERAKQPYHAAENMEARAARTAVERDIEEARRIAVRLMREAVRREREPDNDVAACAVLVADPMPGWSVEEILAVHFRMHKAEGVLFRDVLVRAAQECGLRLVAIPGKLLMDRARDALRSSAGGVAEIVRKLGAVADPPWAKDQKDAALAAIIALQAR